MKPVSNPAEEKCDLNQSFRHSAFPRALHSTRSATAQTGMTLVEVIFAVALLGIVVGSILGLLGANHARSMVNRESTALAVLMRSQIEQALTDDYVLDLVPMDGQEKMKVPSILRITGDPANGTPKDPASFTYSYADETKRRDYTPAFDDFDMTKVDEAGFAVFTGVPVSLAADAGRKNTDLSNKKEALRAPQTTAELRFRTTLLDQADSEAKPGDDSISIVIDNDGTTISNSGLRMFELIANPSAPSAGNGPLPDLRLSTIRAPDGFAQ